MGGSKQQDPLYAITPAGNWFYADATFDARRRRLICVREDHSNGDHEPETHAGQQSRGWSGERRRGDCLRL